MNVNLTGVPFTTESTPGNLIVGPLGWEGITKANYTDLTVRMNVGVTVVEIGASGSGQARAVIGAGDMPTGGTVVLRGSVSYIT